MKTLWGHDIIIPILFLCLFIIFSWGHDFREGERGGEREKHRLVASHRHPTRDQTHNLAVCPDQELNPRPFGLQDDTPTNWATSARAIIIPTLDMRKTEARGS